MKGIIGLLLIVVVILSVIVLLITHKQTKKKVSNRQLRKRTSIQKITITLKKKNIIYLISISFFLLLIGIILLCLH